MTRHSQERVQMRFTGGAATPADQNSGRRFGKTAGGGEIGVIPFVQLPLGEALPHWGPGSWP